MDKYFKSVEQYDILKKKNQWVEAVCRISKTQLQNTKNLKFKIQTRIFFYNGEIYNEVYWLWQA